MMTSTYSLPWSGGRDSAIDTNEEEEENEYSNPASCESNGGRGGNGGTSASASSPSSCPDYEELAGEANNGGTRMVIRTSNSRGGLVYNLASENVFRTYNSGSKMSSVSSPTNNNNHIGSNRKNVSNGSSGFDELEETFAVGAEARQKIMQSTVFCIHKNDGCKWQGPLGKLKAHLNACQRDAVACPRGAGVCGAKIARLMMEDHLLTTCPGRPVSCPHCKREFTGATVEEHGASCGFEPVDCENKCGGRIARNRLRAHQANTCSKRLVGCQYCAGAFAADTLQAHHRKCGLFPVPCPNRCSKSDGSLTSVARDEVERHLAEECDNGASSPSSSSNKNRPCSFEDAGCQFRSACRSAMETHLAEASKLHLDLMCSLVQRQRAHIDKLTSQLERATTSYNGVLVWKVRDFSSRLREARSSEGLELVSVPFFTSQCGYRLQASLFLDGNGSGEGTHLSAYIKILPGEFDSILKWPFRHTVSFSLLDQAEDRRAACNVVESFIPDPEWPNFRRPSPAGDPDQLGFGFPKFVPHRMLADSASSPRKYVRDDCIFVKIRVDPARNVAV